MRHVEHRYHKGRYLTDDGCNRCSLDPHLKDKDKNRVEDYVDDGANDHRKHGIFWTSVGADHRVDGCRNHHERQSGTDDKAVFQRKGTQHIGRTEQRQDGVDPNKKDHSQQNADDGYQGDGVADPLFGGFHLSLAHLQAQIGSSAVADHHGQCQRDDGDGENNVGGAVSKVSHSPADKDLVNDVVQGIDQQSDHAGDDKFYDQPPDRLCGKRTLCLWYCMFHG